jgi:hypothetical protein
MTTPWLAKKASASTREAGGGGSLLVGQDLAEGDPGAIIHGRVDVVVADASTAPGRGAAMDPVAAAVGDAPEFLDVQVNQLARLLALAGHDHAADPVHARQPAHAIAAQHAIDGRAGHTRR